MTDLMFPGFLSGVVGEEEVLPCKSIAKTCDVFGSDAKPHADSRLRYLGDKTLPGWPNQELVLTHPRRRGVGDPSPATASHAVCLSWYLPRLLVRGRN
jgi:hypothetical protein